MGDFGRNNETRCSEESRYLYGKIILGTWQSRYSKDLAIARFYSMHVYNCVTTLVRSTVLNMDSIKILVFTLYHDPVYNMKHF